MKTVCLKPTPVVWLIETPAYRNSELTFIILARTSGGELTTNDIPTLSMVGDVNIFLNGTPGDQDFEAEAEIMIAGGLTLRNIYVPLLPPFTASELMLIMTRAILFVLRTRLSPKRICQPRSATDVFLRHCT